MSKHYKSRKRAKRPLDLVGLKEGRYATIADMSIPASGHPVSPEVLYAKFLQAAKDLRNACPSRAPVNLVVDWQSEIRFRAAVMALPQGALAINGDECLLSSDNSRKLDDSALAEAEEIATSARRASQEAIDIGNAMATEAEKRCISRDDVIKTMLGSPDESVSRVTYGRARGAEAHIHYPDGNRTIGGNKVIPATTHSDETFELLQCSLRQIKPNTFCIDASVPHEGWRRLHAYTPGIELLKGETDSPVLKILLVAANAGIRVDITVCVSEKVATGERWCTPISIQNKHEVFVRGREWLEFLEESLGP